MNIVMTKNDISQISDLLDSKLVPIQGKLSQHDKVLEQHGKILRSLKKDQKIMLEMLDGEQMKQKRRINRIEDHLGLPPAAQ